MDELLEGLSLLPILDIMHFVREVDKAKSRLAFFVMLKPVINLVGINL